MVGEIRRLKFSEGVATGAPVQEYIETISFASFPSDAAYEAAVGAPVESDTYYNTTDKVVRTYDGTAWHSSVTIDQTQIITNKTIDADNNTISNLVHGDEVDNPTAAHGTTGNILGDSDTQTITNKTIDADSNTISNLLHGDEVDNPTSGVHGVTGNIIGDSDTQTITNKTIDADNNTISNLLHGDEVDNPSSGVHGVTSNILGESDTQTVTNKTIDADNNTISNLVHGSEVDNPTIAHGTTTAVAGIGDTQVLTNKDIDGATATDTSRITLPKETTTNIDLLAKKEATVVYDTTLKAPVYTDGTTWKELGGGGGSGVGGINYVDNYNAETDLSGVTISGTIPLSRETVNPLFDTASFKITSSGTDYAGDKVLIETKTFDDAMVYNVIAGEFWVRNTTLDTGDLKVRVYDITNAAYVSLVSGEDILASTIDTPHKFKFQATDSLSYRIEIEIITASLPAFEFIWDNVIVGPEKSAVIGAPVTDWEDITDYANANLLPVNGGSLAGSYTYYKRKQVGDNEHVLFYYSASATGSGASIVVFPLLHEWAQQFQTTGRTYNVQHVTPSTTGFTATSMASITGGLSLTNMGSGGGIVGSNIISAAQISGDFSYKAVGYSSNVVLSETTLNTHIISYASGGGAGAITAGTPITWTLVSNSVGTGWDGTKYTAPEDGNYRFEGLAYVSGYAAQTNIYAKKNGTLFKYVYLGNNTGVNSFPVNINLQLLKGDYVEFAFDSNLTTPDNSPLHNLTIEKTNTGSQTIGISEKVVALYRDSSAQSIPDITQTLVTWNTKDLDTRNALSAGKFKAPKPGIVSINGAFTFTSATNLYTLSVLIYNYTQATYKYVIEENFNGSRSGKLLSAFNAKLLVDVGDELGLLVVQDDGSTASRSFEPDTNYNFIEFTME